MEERDLSIEEREALEGIVPPSRKWTYYFSFTREAPAPRYKYRSNPEHEYKKIRKGDITEVWRRLRKRT